MTGSLGSLIAKPGHSVIFSKHWRNGTGSNFVNFKILHYYQIPKSESKSFIKNIPLFLLATFIYKSRKIIPHDTITP